MIQITGQWELYQYLDSGNHSEQYSHLPVKVGAETEEFSIYSVDVHNIVEGELFDVNVQAQVTNDLDHSVSVVYATGLAQGRLDSRLDPGWETEFMDGTGDNVLKEIQHHHTLVQCSKWISPRGYGLRRINFVCKAVSSAAQPRETVLVDRDYGRLQVFRYRPLLDPNQG